MKELPDDLTPAEARALAADERYWQARATGDESEIQQASVSRAICIWMADSTRIDDLIRTEEESKRP
jgi:hypothetical protein